MSYSLSSIRPDMARVVEGMDENDYEWKDITVAEQNKTKKVVRKRQWLTGDKYKTWLDGKYATCKIIFNTPQENVVYVEFENNRYKVNTASVFPIHHFRNKDCGASNLNVKWEVGDRCIAKSPECGNYLQGWLQGTEQQGFCPVIFEHDENATLHLIKVNDIYQPHLYDENFPAFLDTLRNSDSMMAEKEAQRKMNAWVTVSENFVASLPARKKKKKNVSLKLLQSNCEEVEVKSDRKSVYKAIKLVREINPNALMERIETDKLITDSEKHIDTSAGFSMRKVDTFMKIAACGLQPIHSLMVDHEFHDWSKLAKLAELILAAMLATLENEDEEGQRCLQMAGVYYQHLQKLTTQPPEEPPIPEEETYKSPFALS